MRVIGADGQQLGIMSGQAALRLAEESDLDLVKISPTANPPVCKIMDYGKFKFEQGKKEKESRRNQKVVEVKEVAGCHGSVGGKPTGRGCPQMGTLGGVE